MVAGLLSDLKKFFLIILAVKHLTMWVHKMQNKSQTLRAFFHFDI